VKFDIICVASQRLSTLAIGAVQCYYSLTQIALSWAALIWSSISASLLRRHSLAVTLNRNVIKQSLVACSLAVVVDTELSIRRSTFHVYYRRSHSVNVRCILVVVTSPSRVVLVAVLSFINFIYATWPRCHLLLSCLFYSTSNVEAGWTPPLPHQHHSAETWNLGWTLKIHSYTWPNLSPKFYRPKSPTCWCCFRPTSSLYRRRCEWQQFIGNLEQTLKRLRLAICLCQIIRYSWIQSTCIFAICIFFSRNAHSWNKG